MRAEEISWLYKLPSLGCFAIESPEERSKSTECPVCLSSSVTFLRDVRDVTATEFSPNLLLQPEKNKTNKIPCVHQLQKGLPTNYHFTDRKAPRESNLDGSVGRKSLLYPFGRVLRKSPEIGKKLLAYRNQQFFIWDQTFLNILRPPTTSIFSQTLRRTGLGRLTE